MKAQKILSGRRLSLPPKWLEDNGLEIGDWVIIKHYQGHIEIVPAKVVQR